MICLEISVNGQKVRRVGVKQGTVVVSAGVHAGRKEPDSVALTAGGCVRLSDAQQANTRWDGLPKLSVGDQVSIRVVEADQYDEPEVGAPYARTERTPEEQKTELDLLFRHEPKA